MPKMSTAGVWARGFLYCLIAALTELYPLLVSDQPANWRAASVKIAIAIALSIRTFIDQSTSHTDKEPIAITNAPGQPLETTDVSEPEPEAASPT